MRGFPDDPALGLPSPRPPRASSHRAKGRSRPKRLEPIPEDERTHVPLTRFKLACGAKRIGVERSLIVEKKPTCPGCVAELVAMAQRQLEVRKLAEERGVTEW